MGTQNPKYNDIYQADPYKGIVVNKLECIGHIQKRFGASLRKLKAANTKTCTYWWKKVEWAGSSDRKNY